MSNDAAPDAFKAPPSRGVLTTVYLVAAPDLAARLAIEPNVESWVRQQWPRFHFTAGDALGRVVGNQRVFAFRVRLEIAGVVEVGIKPI